MILRVSVNPELFLWALERLGKDAERRNIYKKFKNLSEWIEGKSQPTFKQLEDFSKATYVPTGYFFLKTPPKEDTPIPDFRTMRKSETARLSPNLLDTIYLCQQRQGWYHDFIRSTYGEKLDFVGSININSPIKESAKKIRHYFGLVDGNLNFRTWEEHLSFFIEKVREQGVLVMINSIVGSNTHRKLDVDEFRGFALSDDFAPLIFINGADAKSAQIFTLAHELAHIGLGKSALSNTSLILNSSNRIEAWCNKVAAELFVPIDYFKKENVGDNPLESVPRLTKKYKVSSLVILRRLFDAKFIRKNDFEVAYKEELEKIKIRPKGKKGGGDFYRTIKSRIGKTFAQDVIISTLEGQTPFTDALDLLGVKKINTFDKMAKDLKISKA